LEGILEQPPVKEFHGRNGRPFDRKSYRSVDAIITSEEDEEEIHKTGFKTKQNKTKRYMVSASIEDGFRFAP
jgi:hypothetical protein